MRKIVVFTNLTLDGVMQAPGRPDEDTRDGFTYGGWGAPYAAMQYVNNSDLDTGPLLFGRRTYEDFYSVWPNRTDNPFTPVLNNTIKYVASTTLKEPLPWMNSVLLQGNVPDAVAALRGQPGKDIVILGSGVLIESLMKHNLIDRYVLQIHPLVLGQGRRLFPENSPFASLRLVDSVATGKGVVVATYQPG